MPLPIISHHHVKNQVISQSCLSLKHCISSELTPKNRALGGLSDHFFEQPVDHVVLHGKREFVTFVTDFVRLPQGLKSELYMIIVATFPHRSRDTIL